MRQPVPPGRARRLQQTFPAEDGAAFDEVVAALFVERPAPRRVNRCAYEFVQCDGAGYALDFYYMSAFSLGGSLAAAIGNCTRLTAIGLGRRGLVGTVPTASRAGAVAARPEPFAGAV